MVSTSVDAHRFLPGTLSLYLDNRHPISAVQLGRLLTALSKDYARFSHGRELALVDAQSGSLRLKLAAVAVGTLAVLTPLNTVADFAERIGQVLAAVEHRPKSLNGSRPGVKSAREILEIAAASGSSFRIDYEAPDGERLVIQMDASETERIQNRVIRENQAIREAPVTGIPAARPIDQALPHGTSTELRSLTDAVKRLAEQPPVGPHEQTTAISALVDVLLQSGAPYSVEQFAAQLEAKGHYDLARMVREELHRKSQTNPHLRY